MAIQNRLKNAWNAFLGRDPTNWREIADDGFGTTYNPYHYQMKAANLRSFVASVYNKIAVDCSMVNILHVRLNEEGRYLETIKDQLNRALTLDPNNDQSGRDLVRDIVISTLDEGYVAVVPYECDVNPKDTESYTVFKMRTAKILEWKPHYILVRIYNEETGNYKEMWVEKRVCAIIENPFYAIMNEPNSTAQSLTRVLNQLDRVNAAASSGKLDMIIQLPFTARTPIKKRQAEERRKSIEDQINGSQLGVAYIDGTEKVIQLNRPLENNLWEQAKDLTQQLLNQLGFSMAVFDGTADEQTMINYQNNTLAPILAEITEAMERKWISKTAQTQLQGIRFYMDPFRLVPVQQLAEMVDKFTRNEIMSSNEFRSVMGLKQSKDPKADQLINSNLNQSKQDIQRFPVEEKKEEENSK